jgi:hypothetical protein
MSSDEIWDECRRLELETIDKTQLADRIIERFNIDGGKRFAVFACVYKEWPNRLVELIQAGG